jgi:hypothetical protein
MRCVGYLHGAKAGRLLRAAPVPPDRMPGVDECQSPLVFTCDCGTFRVTNCRNHRESRCRPCATRYRRRVYRLFEYGLTRIDRATSGYLYGWTLTAPGEAGHQRWIPGARGLHGRCDCPDSMDDPALWNATAAERWNALRTRLRQLHPGLVYVRAVEVQHRGLLHFHVLMHSPTKCTPLEMQLLGLAHGFGCVMDLQLLPLNAGAAARYAAKYVSKSVDSREQVPWSRDVVDRITGEVSTSNDPTYRAWSGSRDWGIRMRDIVDASRDAARAQQERLRDQDQPRSALVDAGQVADGDRPPD